MIIFTAIVKFAGFVADNFNEFLHKNGPYMAAAISFYTFLSLFPLSIAMITLLSLLLGVGNIEERLIEALVQQIPVLQEPDDRFLAEFFGSLRSGRAVTSSLAIGGLLWASTAVFGAIRKSVNSIWGISKSRPFLMERMMDFALMFGTAALLMVSIAVSIMLAFIRQLSESLFPGSSIPLEQLWQVLGQLIPPFLSLIVFTVLYWWLPNTRLSIKHIWPTAIAATIAFEISKQIFVLYLQNLGGITNNIYGGVSALIVLLVFVYVSSIIMLVGAMLTARYTFYLDMKSQNRFNENISHNLARIRTAKELPGMPQFSPSRTSVRREWQN